MGSIWLHSLPDVLRAAGLTVEVYPGWRLRSRSSGGYDSLLAVQVHHTASRTTPKNDMSWMWDNAPERPIGACHLARNGVWTVGAAGATNTSGKGGPLKTSKGTIPLDAANRHVLSVEAANDGVGEAWPKVQQDSYVTGVNAFCRAYGIGYDLGDVHGHFEWTDRKIDPAGPSKYATGRDSWNMDLFRSDVRNLSTPPTPTPDPEVIAMRILILKDAGNAAVLLTGHIATWLDPARYKAFHTAYNITDEPAAKSWLANVVFTGPLPTGVTKADVWQHQP